MDDTTSNHAITRQGNSRSTLLSKTNLEKKSPEGVYVNICYVMASTDRGKSGSLAQSSSMVERLSSGEKRRWFLMTRSFLPTWGPRSCHHTNIFCPVFGVHSNTHQRPSSLFSKPLLALILLKTVILIIKKAIILGFGKKLDPNQEFDGKGKYESRT